MQTTEDNTTLGVSSLYKWNQTSTTSTTAATTLVNSFSVLDGARGSTGGGGIGRRDNKEPYNSKGSMERDRYGKKK